jgi:hypothetical protein
MMLIHRCVVGASCVLAALAMVGSAQSAYGGTVTSVPSAAIAGSNVANVAYRLCVTDGGVRRCRWVEIYGPGASGYRPPNYGYGVPGGYGYAAPSPGVVLVNPPPVLPYALPFRNPTEYYPTEPNDYPVGVPRWWRNMDRWDQGGNGSN